MGIRGELFSTRFASEGRTYFFNVKQNRNGDVFLSIIESKPGEGESFDRRSIVVFGEQMEGFLKSFQTALKFMSKTGNKVDPDPMASQRYEEESQNQGKSPDAARRRREGPRTERSSSFRDHGGAEHKPEYKSENRPERRYEHKTEHKPEHRTERKYTVRTGSPAARRAPPERQPAERQPAERRPAERRPVADTPVRKIVVRRARRPDSES